MSNIIGCDIDGVLADFNTGYARKITQRFGLTIPPYDRASFPSTWTWERDLGLTQAQENEVWEKDIKSNPGFWLALPAYPWTVTVLDNLEESHYPVYFITSRSGKFCKEQTEGWLKNYTSYPFSNPTVCVVKSHKLKVDVINGLSITHYIDDRLDTMKLLAGNTQAKLYLFDQPWNRGYEFGQRVKRVYEMEEFLGEALG